MMNLYLWNIEKNCLKGNNHMVLECKNLRKAYGNFTAIEKIDYMFSPGVYGLLGPNGAGKSTWMKLLTASMKTTEGKIICDEKSVYDDVDEYVGKIGYVPQNQNMFPYFTGYKFMQYMATLKGVKKENASKQIPELLRCVNMDEYGKRRIGSYSGGMKQRLLIAQAFLGDPQVVFMDEPTAGLDPKERIRIRNLISKMSMGKIILIATHVVPDVEYISKEILLLRKGRIIRSGSPESLEEELNGIVCEKEVTVEQLNEIQEKYPVAGIRKEGSRVLVRYLDSHGDEEFKVRPTLDDVYLYHFYKEQSNDTK